MIRRRCRQKFDESHEVEKCVLWRRLRATLASFGNDCGGLKGTQVLTTAVPYARDLLNQRVGARGGRGDLRRRRTERRETSSQMLDWLCAWLTLPSLDTLVAAVQRASSSRGQHPTANSRSGESGNWCHLLGKEVSDGAGPSRSVEG